MVTAPNLSERYPEHGNERIAPNARINKNPPNAAGLNSNRITKAGIRDAHIPKVLPLKIKALATITQSLENLDTLIQLLRSISKGILPSKITRFRSSFLGAKINMNDTKSLGISKRPFIIIQKRPCKITCKMNPLRF